MEEKTNKTPKAKLAKIWQKDAFISLGCGFLAASVMLGGTYALGRVTNYEAKILLDSILPTTRFLCSSIMTASATIIALMLTLLGLSFNVDMNLSDDFFKRIKTIAFYDTVILAFATGLLVLHCFPIIESDSVPSWWYLAGYYTILTASTILGGGLIALVTMLYLTVRETIYTFGIGSEGRFVVVEEEDDDEAE